MNVSTERGIFLRYVAFYGVITYFSKLSNNSKFTISNLTLIRLQTCLMIYCSVIYGICW